MVPPLFFSPRRVFVYGRLEDVFIKAGFSHKHRDEFDGVQLWADMDVPDKVRNKTGRNVDETNYNHIILELLFIIIIRLFELSA